METTPDRTCATCGTTFQAKAKNRANRYCSGACYQADRRGKQRKTGVQHRMMRAPGHPVSPSSGIALISRVVLYDSIGPGPHRCHWCGAEVDWMPGAGLARGALIVDHLNHDAADDALPNLVASCNTCNARRNRNGPFRPIIQPGELLVTMPNGNRTRATERTCATCGNSFLVPTANLRTKKRQGIYCSPQCQYDRNRAHAVAPAGGGQEHGE